MCDNKPVHLKLLNQGLVRNPASNEKDRKKKKDQEIKCPSLPPKTKTFTHTHTIYINRNTGPSHLEMSINVLTEKMGKFMNRILPKT